MSVKLISHSTAPADSELDNVQDLIAYCAKVSNPNNQINKETSEKLIKFLIKHNHWSPLEMVSVCFEIETTQVDSDFSTILRPASCAGGLQVTAKDGATPQDGEIQQCHIQDWGPKIVVQGQAFNRNFQGNSEIWVDTECAVENVSVVLGSRLVDTDQDRSRITGSFSAERSLKRLGKYEVTLYDMNTGHIKTVGKLEATPAL